MSAQLHIPSDFGLHRGRRVVAGLLAAAAIGWGGWVALGGPQPVPAAPPAPAPEPVAAAVAPKAKSKVAQRNPSRRAKAVRTAPAATAQRAVPTPAPAVVPPPAPPAEVPGAPAAPDDAPAFAAFPSDTAGEPPPMPPAEPATASEESDLGNGEAIARAIAADQRSAVRACFERELKSDPKLQGTVAVELDLVPPNQVSAVRVSDDLARPAFTDCVSDAMRHARFAALNEEVHVRVPYVLTAEAK